MVATFGCQSWPWQCWRLLNGLSPRQDRLSPSGIRQDIIGQTVRHAFATRHRLNAAAATAITKPCCWAWLVFRRAAFAVGAAVGLHSGIRRSNQGKAKALTGGRKAFAECLCTTSGYRVFCKRSPSHRVWPTCVRLAYETKIRSWTIDRLSAGGLRPLEIIFILVALKMVRRKRLQSPKPGKDSCWRSKQKDSWGSCSYYSILQGCTRSWMAALSAGQAPCRGPIQRDQVTALKCHGHRWVFHTEPLRTGWQSDAPVGAHWPADRSVGGHQFARCAIRYSVHV